MTTRKGYPQEKVKFFTLSANNLSGEVKKVHFLSEFGLKDSDVKYFCNGDEKSYYEILKQIERNPLLIYMLRIQFSDVSNMHRPKLISMNRHNLKSGLMRESRMMMPLSFFDPFQFQMGIVDIPCAFGLDYASDITYELLPYSSMSVSLFCIDYDRNEHEKLKEENDDALNGHPIWIENKSDDLKVFKLFTNKKNYTKEQLEENQLHTYFWENRMDLVGITENIFDNEEKEFIVSRVFSTNKNQLKNNLEFDCGDGKVYNLPLANLFAINQFQDTIVDIKEFFQSAQKIQNQFGSEYNAHHSYIKMIVQPKTSLCLWIKAKDK